MQVGVPGLATYGAGGGATEPARTRRTTAASKVWEPRPYVPHRAQSCSSTSRKKLGDEVELLHDMHERVPPILAMQLVKDLEQYRPFFLEDPFSPEDIGYFEHLRTADEHADRDGRAVQQPERMARPRRASG